jgi:hypothetical protein
LEDEDGVTVIRAGDTLIAAGEERGPIRGGHALGTSASRMISMCAD